MTNYLPLDEYVIDYRTKGFSNIVTDKVNEDNHTEMFI